MCTYRGSVRVDIRQFINNESTMKGIFFDRCKRISLPQRNTSPCSDGIDKAVKIVDYIRDVVK